MKFTSVDGKCLTTLFLPIWLPFLNIVYSFLLKKRKRFESIDSRVTFFFFSFLQYDVK